MMLPFPSRLVLLSCAFALLASWAQAAPLYNATVLTTPGLQPEVEGLDNNGQVLLFNSSPPPGEAIDSLYNAQAGGTITTFTANDNSPPATQFTPQYISGNGNLIGWLGSQPVLFSGGQYAPIPGWGQAVNDSGQVAYVDGMASHNSYIVTNGVSTNLGHASGYETTEVSAINNSGQAVGTVIHALAGGGYQSLPFLYDGQHLTVLGTLGGSVAGAIGINNHGDIIGSSTDALGNEAGFVSYKGGPLVSIGTLPGSYWSLTRSINDNGQIVGAALGYGVDRGLGVAQGAFFYQNGVLTDLSKLLSPSAANISLTDAYAINDAGQIVAQGFLGGENQPQLFLLTPDGQPIPPSPNPLIQTAQPVPEPSAPAIFGLVIAGIFASRWRR